MPATWWPTSARSDSKGVSKQAVKGILARVCLNAAGRLGKPEYAEARKWAWSLMEEGVCSLNPDYSDVFIRKLMQDEYDIRSRSSRWSVTATWSPPEMKETGQFWPTTPMYSSRITAWTRRPKSIARGRRVSLRHAAALRLYGDGDLRRDWTIMPYMYKNEAVLEQIHLQRTVPFPLAGQVPPRVRDQPPGLFVGNSTNYPLLRFLRRVALMFAEADNMVNNGSTPESLEAVTNQVPRRAFRFDPLTPLPEVDMKAMSRTEFLEYIQAERARNWRSESHRRLDLMRWGIFLDRMHEIGEELAAIP